MCQVFSFGSLLLLLVSAASAAEMVNIPAGSFMMGCSKGDVLCGADEKPTGKVTVPAFLMDAKEVTVAV